MLKTKEPELPNEMQELLKKKRLTSTTDLILKNTKNKGKKCHYISCIHTGVRIANLGIFPIKKI